MSPRQGVGGSNTTVSISSPDLMFGNSDLAICITIVFKAIRHLLNQYSKDLSMIGSEKFFPSERPLFSFAPMIPLIWVFWVVEPLNSDRGPDG
ncbi:hypothetical protein HanIR_Chr04g0190861 [Helianthus annuus]|nr:hypothetical protein HanIR_Chr04g0190861 [Helianthus annuus]